jgi:hypothetical protein
MARRPDVRFSVFQVFTDSSLAATMFGATEPKTGKGFPVG